MFREMTKEKESWLTKLIELLNEFEIEREEKIDLFNDKEKPLWEWYKDCTGDLTFEPTDSKILNGEAFSGDTANSVIISKSYGFIKWLVENDKIDREQFYDKARKIITDFDLKGEYEGACNEIIMLLSIQDNPIEFLVSILK